MANKDTYVGGGDLLWRTEKHTSTAFIGGTSNAHGDHDGTGDPYTIFTVTGMVMVRYVFGVCNTSLVGAATLEVGTANNTAKLIAQIANTTTLDAGDIYTDAGTEAEVDLVPSKMFANDGKKAVVD